MAFSFQDLSSIQKNAIGSFQQDERSRPVSSNQHVPRPSSVNRYTRNREQSADYQRHRTHGRASSREPQTRYNRAPSGQRMNSSALTQDLKPWNIFDVILKVYHGKTLLKNIRRLFPESMTIENIKNWLENDKSDRFVVFTDSSERISYVAVNCSGKLCLQYGQNGCSRPGCKYFHLCRHYVGGQCAYENCRYFHDFQNNHNKELVRRYHLAKYSESELKIIIHNSLLEVCHSYNNGTCHAENGCTHLHVCESFIMAGSCSKEDCTLDHSFNHTHTRKLLEVFKLDRLLEKPDTLRKCILVYHKFDHKKLHTSKGYHPRDATSRNEAVGRSVNRPFRGNRERYKSSGRRDLSRDKEKCEDADESNTMSNFGDTDPKHSASFDGEEIWAGPGAYHSTNKVSKPEDDVSMKQEPCATRSSRNNPVSSFGIDEFTKSSDEDDEQTIPKMKRNANDRPVINSHIGVMSNDESSIRQKLRNMTTKEKPVMPELRQSHPLRTVRREQVKESSSDHSGSFQKDFICEANLCKQCYKGDNCLHLHHDSPYMWFIKAFGEWYHLDKTQEKSLEEAFHVADNDQQKVKVSF